MNRKLKEKIMEALSSTLPITLIVFVLSIVIVPMNTGTIVMFFVGAALLVVGMGFFSLGAELSMIPMGEAIGAQFTRSKKLAIVIFACFLLGFIITIAEPDLQALAVQVPSIPGTALIMTVAVGVGIFLVVAVLRIVIQIKLSHMLIILYAMLFIVSLFVPDAFIAVAFDSGGVTTGPITVPFILAMGVGLASIRSGKGSGEDSFGFVALCSVGPILAVLILGICYNPESAAYSSATIPVVDTTRDVMRAFADKLPDNFWHVVVAIAPICVFSVVFQLIYKRFNKRQLLRMVVGLVYLLIGLTLFLTGVNVGFIPVGNLLGSDIAVSEHKWLLVPIGMIMGYFIVAAEPAVHILNKQVEEISCGAIPPKAMNLALSIGVAVSVGLSMVRILTGISIYWILVPGYVIALALTFIAPKIFIGIAFDSGGVASGPMTSTFLLPFAIGSCEAFGGNVMTDAFGIVAFVAMTPLIAIQLMGLLYTRKAQTEVYEEPTADEDEIFEIEVEQRR